MSKSRARFVYQPRNFEELIRIPVHQKPQAYEVEKTQYLNAIDYDNFVSDLTVDRVFIEESADLCRIEANSIWHCILVKRCDQDDGILVMSCGEAYPQFAAYLEEMENHV